MHDLRSLSQRLLLSPAETLDQVAAGNLLALDSRNGKHLFSSRSLDTMRNRVVDFIAGEIVEEMTARGFGEDRICFALERAFQKQFELSRGRGENVVEFANADDDDDDSFYGNAKKTAGTAAGIGAAGLAGYGAYKGYRYLRNRGNGAGPDNGPGSQPQLPPGGGSSGDVMNPQHPGPPAGALTTASPAPETIKKTAGQIAGADDLSEAIARGRSVIAQRGSALWKALRAVALAE
ncbi:MAG: hypothetical protein LV481_04615 [Methylacidiphilales bacterium]|nr:hypothetical protein [Candidatus Methylacidiphilales bacterium]